MTQTRAQEARELLEWLLASGATVTLDADGHFSINLDNVVEITNVDEAEAVSRSVLDLRSELRLLMQPPTQVH